MAPRLATLRAARTLTAGLMGALADPVMNPAPVLSVNGLSVCFTTARGVVRALEDVSFAVQAGQTVALVGESGSGKSVTSLSILRLLPPSGRIAAGQILYRGFDGDQIDLAQASERRLRGIRGAGVSMIFQEPMRALNPAFTIGAQIAETIRLHQKASRSQAYAHAQALLTTVGIAEPARRLHDYPHQLSGGMRQRAMIAMAVACRPALLIADEPTTALDVTTQAQVLVMLRDLQAELGMGILFITHNLALVPLVADRLIVMYAGQIVEAGEASTVLNAPRHPYTQALLECLPARHLPRDRTAWRDLPTIEGAAVDLVDRPTGCAFASRCPMAVEVCRQRAPELRPVAGQDRATRCWRAEAL
jgi:peptide/nickel transport system ATP-binding protein